jgi:mutual gliding-motility protein MglA
MASVNRLKRELIFKIVFYGPGLGGKTTTLQYVHKTAQPESRGNMVSLATDTDRTLYFDYLPLRILQVGDLNVRLQLYTVPGQVYYAATRKLVLSGADGLVFVADTQSARLDANLESLEDLNSNLAEQGRKLSSIPHVFQWNKRDLPDIVPLDELDRRLNLFGAPSLPSVAPRGEGVFEVLERVTRQVLDSYRAEPTAAGTKPEVPMFLDADEVGLADAIKGLTNTSPTQASPSPRKARTPTSSQAEAGLAAPAASSQSGNATPAGPQATGSVFSLADLWPSADRPAVRRAELCIAAHDATGAVSACEDLVSRVLAAGSVLLGGQPHPRDPAIVVTMLGLEGARYLAFRAVTRGVRAKREPSVKEALECFVFAIEARRSLDRVAKGP